MDPTHLHQKKKKKRVTAKHNVHRHTQQNLFGGRDLPTES